MGRVPVTCYNGLAQRTLLRETGVQTHLLDVIEDNDLTAAVVNVLTVANLAKLADQDLDESKPGTGRADGLACLVAVVRGLDLRHLLRVVLTEGVEGGGVQNRVVGQERTDV